VTLIGSVHQERNDWSTYQSCSKPWPT